MRLINILIFLIFSSCLYAKNDLLFIGFDAGETNIWVQILKDWEEIPQVQVLTMSTATKVANDAALAGTISLESLGTFSSPQSRLQELTAENLEKIGELSTAILVTGMYSTPARQIAELFAKKGVKVIAVWDNFSTYDKLPADLIANVEKIVRSASIIFVPSQEIARDLNTRFDCDKALALGQPTLDFWERKIAEIDRKAVFAKTPFNSSKPVITYISGYEEKGNNYNDSFTLFAESLQSFPAQLIIQLHPRSDGSHERQVLGALSRENLHFPPFFISDGQLLSTFEAVALADLVACHRSTVAIQALFAGKHCLHVDVSSTPFSHFAIEAGLIPQCFSTKETVEHISQDLQQPLNVEDLYEKSGILPHSTEKYRSYLKQLLLSAQPCAEENHGVPSKR